MIARMIIISVVIFIAMETAAQVKQVAFDNDNKLFEIDRELESKLSLFQEYNNFQNAKLYQMPTGDYTLEIYYMIDESNFKTIKELTANDVLQLRENVTQCINSSCPTILLDQSGRSSLLIWNAFYSLGFYGSAVPIILGATEANSVIGLYSLTSAAGFFIPYFITKESQVTDGMATLATYGGFSGLLHGLFIDWIFSGDNKHYNDGYYYTSDPFEFDKTTYLLMTLFSIGETIASYNIASNNNLSSGSSSVICSTSLLGTINGLAFTYLIDEDSDESEYAISGLVGSLGGAAVGAMVANKQNFSQGDAKIYSTGGYLGAWIPFTLLTSLTDFEDADWELVIGASILGSIGGLVAANSLVEGYDFTSSQGSYVSYGTTLAGLLGLGLGVSMSSKSTAPAMLMSLLASTATYGLLYDSFRKGHEEIALLDNIDVHFSPDVLLDNSLSIEIMGANFKPRSVFSICYSF